MANTSDKKHSASSKVRKQKATVGIIAGSVVFRIIVIVFLIILISFAVGKTYRFGYRLFSQETMEAEPGTDIKVLITEQMDSDTVAKLFEQKGLVSDAVIFGAQLKFFTGSSYRLTPGEYTLNTSMPPREMINAICSESPAESTEKEYLGLYDEAD
ncbi:MAG: aminodeoxychorismate lyase [Lachnospiraceae bacterium]|nr:aminodeoxychorismate lyase [Lachnospiraceae bacterium]